MNMKIRKRKFGDNEIVSALGKKTTKQEEILYKQRQQTTKRKLKINENQVQNQIQKGAESIDNNKRAIEST